MEEYIKENELDNSRRENANINADTPMGLMLKYGTDTAKKYNLENLVEEETRKYHEEGVIHIHDLDFYSSTSTCCQIDLSKLFKNGFSTGNGFLREPNSIATAFALSAIAIQSNQSDQHGGQSIPAIDYHLSPYVLKSYIKHLVTVVEIAEELDVKEAVRLKAELSDGLKSIEEDKKVEEIISGFIKSDAVFTRLIKKAKKMLDREVYQGAEGFIHNLNTLNSRSGSQVPFSSINYGTDTSAEGRLITRNILLATEAGLGNGETPIFPIQIFKTKEGVNFNKEDPNYDLFQLSMRVSSKRLFPNYSFLDSSFNAPYLKEGKPETEVAYMGCAQKDELIVYREGSVIKTSGIGRLYEKLSREEKVCKYGISKFINIDSNIEVYDSSQKKFVGIKKIIKNPNLSNWYKVSFYDGHSLKLTEDHPLYIKNRGRVEVKNLKKGNEVYSSNIEIEKGLFQQHSDLAWWYGVLTNAHKIRGKYHISFERDRIEIVKSFERISKAIGYKIRSSEKKNNITVRFSGRSNKQINRFIRSFYLENSKDIRLPIPNEIFTYDDISKSAFIAGLLDVAGKVEETDTEYLINYFVAGHREKALQLQSLLNTMDIRNNSYSYLSGGNKRNEISRVEFQLFNNFIKESRNYKVAKELSTSKIVGDFNIFKNPLTKTISKIERIEIFEDSYDLETVSDRFDLSGVVSHNCRTRVMSNIYDETEENVSGRGNLSFTSVNLPGLALRAEKSLDSFFKLLDNAMEVITRQLLSRMKQLGTKTDKNFLFLIGQKVWKGTDKLNSGEEISEVIKHGTLTYGFVGLAEALKLLTGKHHGESEEAQELGIKIVEHMREFADKKANEYKLNFSLIATPAESLAGRFNKIDREKFGEIQGITDKGYYTNSFHIPVDYKISVAKKIELEGAYHKLTNGGHITYIELDGDPSKNLKAFEKIIRKMRESDVGYGSINHPVDDCPHCNFTGIIYNECPKCGFKDGTDGKSITRIRRITGYIVKSLDRWNDAKRAELKDRVKHNEN